MRTLFSSEFRCISNLIEMKWGARPHSAPSILSEFVEEPSDSRRRPLFNCDFNLDFVDRRTASSEHMATMSPILPNTLGAELFLVVQKTTLSPMTLELIGGGALGIEYYSTYCEQIEKLIADTTSLQRDSCVLLPQNELTKVASITKKLSGYCHW